MKKIFVAITILISITLIAGCIRGDNIKVSSPKELGVIKKYVDIIDMYEAFFRHLFESDSITSRKPKAYFLEILQQEPPPELLERFKGNSPPVKSISEFRTDIYGKQNGIKFWIHRFEIKGNIAVITGGIKLGNLGMETGVYTFELRKGKWELKTYSPGIVS